MIYFVIALGIIALGAAYVSWLRVFPHGRCPCGGKLEMDGIDGSEYLRCRKCGWKR